jgi:hypothetical protein
MVSNIQPTPAQNARTLSLSEALTLIAFGEVMSAEELRHAVEGDPVPDERTNDEKLRDFFANIERPDFAEQGNGPFTDRDAGLARLSKAWEALKEAVCDGTLIVRGRYSATYSASDAQVADVEALTRDRISTFSQFDVSTGGIRRQLQGQPSVLWAGHAGADQREYDAALGLTPQGDGRFSDGYLHLTIDDGDLWAALMEGRDPGNPPLTNQPPTIQIENERIAQIVELASADAKDKLGRELAANRANAAKTGAQQGSRFWVALASLLAVTARTFIDDLADKVTAIQASDGALAAYSFAVESFMAYLDCKYKAAWVRNASWRRTKDAPPPAHWEVKKRLLLLAVEVQKGRFMQPSEQADQVRSERAPSVKAGRPPSDDEILAKADEMKGREMKGRTIASEMRHEPGFENVATTQVRELIKGRWRPNGRPKRNGA